MKTPSIQAAAMTMAALLVAGLMAHALTGQRVTIQLIQAAPTSERLGQIHHQVRQDGGVSLSARDWRLLVESASSPKASVRSTAFWTLDRVRTPSLRTAAKELVHLASIDPDPAIRRSSPELEYTLKVRDPDESLSGPVMAQVEGLRVD